MLAGTVVEELTEVAAEVALHPPDWDTLTVYDPLEETKIDEVVAPFDHK
jgi:hypothetical protein